LNQELIKRMGVCKSAQKDLEMMHECMNAMVYMHDRKHKTDPLTPYGIKKLRKTVRRMEYLMQRLWGFDRNKELHYHWARFDALCEDRVIARDVIYTNMIKNRIAGYKRREMLGTTQESSS
jgi:hypothetical protein